MTETEDEISLSFKRFDLDGNGTIDREEFAHVLNAASSTWTVDKIDKLWNDLDANGDNVISLEEFSDWLLKPSAAELQRRGSRKLKEPSLEKLSEEDFKKRSQDLVALKLSIKHGDLGLEDTLTKEDLEKTWAELTEYHAHGKLVEDQNQGDLRPWEVFGDPSGFPSALPSVECRKGHKGAGDKTPNQDNFSITRFKNGYTLLCVFDGHGTDGHHTSYRTVQTVPHFLATSSSDFTEDIEDALQEAFTKAQSELVKYTIENHIDVQESGTTAAAVLWKDRTVWLATAGDSRAVIFDSSKAILTETRDHKPDDKAEAARILSSGGEITRHDIGGVVNHRVYQKGKVFPGLCMTRSLGDCSGKVVGVIAEPEVYSYELPAENDPCLVIASDGVWEFIASKKLAKLCKLEQGSAKVVDRIMKESAKQWRMHEGSEYCDDITCMILAL